MAERRMFAKSIMMSGKALRLPATSRLLLYDLGMNADDDGIVEAYNVLTMTGAKEDDLRVLVAKGYVRVLNEDLVSQIMDWNANNSIRSDRYHPSIYKDLVLQISCQPSDNQMTTKWQPSDNQMATEVRLGKVSIGKNSIECVDFTELHELEEYGKTLEKKPTRFTPPTLEEVKAYAEARGYPEIAQKFYGYFTEGNWVDSRGNKVKNWKQKLLTWIDKEPKKNTIAEMVTPKDYKAQNAKTKKELFG